MLRQMPSIVFVCCFFFQAEDGIRDYKVTGVQTCALPIFEEEEGRLAAGEAHLLGVLFVVAAHAVDAVHGKTLGAAQDGYAGHGGRVENPGHVGVPLAPWPVGGGARGPSPWAPHPGKPWAE